VTSDIDLPTRSPLRIWHLTLLPVLVGLAYVNILDQSIEDPLLMGLAIAGFVGYGAIAWWLWSRGVPRLERAHGTERVARWLNLGASTVSLVANLAVMGAMILLASVAYVSLELQLK
jgi:hypothetical protein